jgi:hypothetical protein
LLFTSCFFGLCQHTIGIYGAIDGSERCISTFYTSHDKTFVPEIKESYETEIYSKVREYKGFFETKA